MALATQQDVEAALGRSLADGESVDSLLEEASDLAAAYLGGEPDPVPPPVTRVVASMVVAVLRKPATTTADYNAGGYYQQREVTTVQVGVESATTTGPWLTKSLRQRLAPYRMKPARAAFTIDVLGVDSEVDLNGGAWWRL